MSGQKRIHKEVSTTPHHTPASNSLQVNRLKLPEHLTNSESSQQPTPSIEEQRKRADHFNYNFLDIPVDPPEPPPPPIQRKFEGLENNAHQQSVPKVNPVLNGLNWLKTQQLDEDETIERQEMSEESEAGEDNQQLLANSTTPQVQLQKDNQRPSGFTTNYVVYPGKQPNTIV
ncbi:MAG TPA: hypothetical protein DCL61_07880 [Cyanobacteria bacterium UBA12227]|nr:hypothetical protein [Cyanobacteria bacterium UBA12227]HAX90509.1 hypothetical protein [Cyanobacteria bacterium UBA11370]